MKNIFAVLLLSAVAFAQGGVQNNAALKSTGQPAGGASIRVCAFNATGTPCLPLANIYSDNTLTIPKSNPFAADSYGNYSYFAVPGIYKEQVTIGGTTHTSFIQISIDANRIQFGSVSTQSLNGVRFADQFCTVAGTYDQTCWNNAIANLPSTGGLVKDTACRDYTISSSINVTKSGVHLEGCGQGTSSTGGTRFLAANSTVTPILNWAGPSTIITNGSLKNIRIDGVYTANQKCSYFNYFNHVDVNNVQFYDCGIGMDVDYGFLLRVTDSDFANCGSGDTAATACTRVENRSNTAVATEQVWFNHNSWGCDQVTRTNQGMAVYIGPHTDQTYIRGSKLDYTNCSFSPRVIALYQTQLNLIQDNFIAAGSVSYPTTASALIDVNGTAGTKSEKNNIQNNYLLFWTATPAVKIDYGMLNLVSGNNLEGSGTGTAITLTANSSGNQAGPNWLSTADTYLSNAAVSNIALSEKIDSTYSWWFRDRISVGATPAVSGGVALPNNTAISARNAANSADISLMYLDGSNNIQFGAQGIFQTAVSAPLVVATSGGVKPSSTADAITWFKKATHATLDLASVASGAISAIETETITGAALGDSCNVSSATALEDGGQYVCNVTATDTVKWYLKNNSGGAIDRASDTYTIRVTR